MKVVSNTAISLDGRINTRERRFAFFGSSRDHARMSRLRADADAVLVGGATFRNWPHPALPDIADRARLRGRPWNVVVSRSLDLPPAADYFADPAIRPLLLTRAASLHGRRPPAEAEGWAGEGEDLPVPWILEQLARRGVERLLVEAGGDLLFQFLAAEAIDEMYLTLCPLVVGGDAPSLADGPGFDLAELRRMRLLAAEPEGDEVFLHYAAVREGATR
jgi:5-amino-6-(5-phosphoribosylamino)uracil reductase